MGANTYVLRELPRLKVVETAVEDLNCHFGPPDLPQKKLWCCSSQNRELRRSTTSETAGGLGLSYGTCQRTVHAADLPEVCAVVGRRRAEAEEIFGCWKHGCCPHPLPYFIWPPMISSCLREWIRSSCKGVVSRIVLKNSGTISIRRACDSKMLVSAVPPAVAKFWVCCL